MRKTLLLLSSLALLASCSSTQVLDADPRIMIDSSAVGLVKIVSVDYGETQGNNPVVALSMMSTSDFERQIQYRTIWFDPNGAAIDSPLSKWKTVTIFSGEVSDFRAVAPRSDAQGFRIEIRKAP